MTSETKATARRSFVENECAVSVYDGRKEEWTLMGFSAPGWCSTPFPLNTFIAQSTVPTALVRWLHLTVAFTTTLSFHRPPWVPVRPLVYRPAGSTAKLWMTSEGQRQVRRTKNCALPPPSCFEDVADAGQRQIIRSHRLLLLPFAQEKFSCQEWNLSLTSLTAGNI